MYCWFCGFGVIVLVLLLVLVDIVVYGGLCCLVLAGFSWCLLYGVAVVCISV